MIQRIKLSDEKYPKLLKKLVNPPQVINVIGEINICNKRPIAVVGSRKMTEYGRNVISDLVGNLIKLDFTIVSGLAEGVDSACQNLALKLNKKTTGVLGFGFRWLKFDRNKKLAEEILKSQNGCLISPFDDEEKPSRHSFIERNKVIAGLCLGVLVIEAGEKSGTNHVTDTAQELERPVFAVPGSIFSYTSHGTHLLIKNGAVLTEDTDDILNIFDRNF